MMSGLMMVFLFIAIAFMIEADDEKNIAIQEKKKAQKMAKNYKITQESIHQIITTYNISQQELNSDLNKEFKNDLQKWKAEITDDNIFRFNSPEVLFKTGSSQISTKFSEILNNFFQRYIKILTSNKYKNEIDEIRIEGHTSKRWGKHSSQKEIYLKNMKLSQDRASSVLDYCYNIDKNTINLNRLWLEKKLRANGMSFSKIIFTQNGEQDYDKSRRVEFKVSTKEQEKIFKIIQQL